MVLLPLAVLLAWLGWWQMERMHEKQERVARFESALPTTLENAIETSERFARISATGRFDTRHHVLLDNQVHSGKAGVHVYTPFRTFSGRWILVNRGWKPLSADRSIPEVWTPAVPVGIRGRLDRPPDQYDKLGEPDKLSADEGPQLVTYFDTAAIADTLSIDLPQWVILLDADDPNGFEGREWKPVSMTPQHHRAYAFQWFVLSLAALTAWAAMGLRRGRPRT